LALFHRRLTLISLFALVAAAISVYYQVFLRGLIRLPPTTDTMTAKVSRSVIQTVFAKEQAEGVGARVRRAIGTPQLRNISPFLMLDHFNLGPGSGFPDHPHRGQATVTYIIEGASMHEDSAGHKGTIKAGGVQYMTAGKGVIHSEIPVHGPGLPNPMGFQLWVDLPVKYKMIEPQYHELDPEDIPSAYPEGPDGPVQIKLISGKSFDKESPVKPLGGCWYMHVFLKKRGAKVFQDIPAGWTAFFYTLKGVVYVNRETDGQPKEPHHVLVFSSAANETGVQLEAAEDDTQGVLIAGEPLDQPILQYGPFVMTNQAEIQQTLVDYRLGQNGFERAHSWKSQIGKEFLERYGNERDDD